MKIRREYMNFNVARESNYANDKSAFSVLDFNKKKSS